MSSNGFPALSSLALESSVDVLCELVHCLGRVGGSEAYTGSLHDLLSSVPPNFHAEVLDKLAPEFDSVTTQCTDERLLDFIDDLALILLSPSIRQIDMEKFKFPSRKPERYLRALGVTRNMAVVVSRQETPWKRCEVELELLSSALTKMPLLRHLTLRHLQLASSRISSLLHGLATCCSHLAYLDLKYGSLTDSGTIWPQQDTQPQDCVSALLRMTGLQQLNVSQTQLSLAGMQQLVKQLPLQRLEAITDGHDLQVAAILALPENPPLVLPRTAYTLAPDEPHTAAICEACPQLECVAVQHCNTADVKPLFLALSSLQHLRAVKLCGLEWLSCHAHIAINEDPMPISTMVTEVTLTEGSFVDASHLGALSICFPKVTSLWVESNSDDGCGEPWDGGQVFKYLTHLHYQGSVEEDFTRLQREAGLHSLMDVLLAWSTGLRSITLYTDAIDSLLVHFALQRNELRHLEELRLGQREEMDCDTIMSLVSHARALKLLGRTDWWTGMEANSKEFVISTLKQRYNGLVVFGQDEITDIQEDPQPPRSTSPDLWQ